jgi:hypothetical protein
VLNKLPAEYPQTGRHCRTYVSIEEDPGPWTLWETYLEAGQERWKEEFGEQKGQKNPDLRPEFKRGWLPDPEDE